MAETGHRRNVLPRESAEEQRIPLAGQFDVLKNARRRFVLEYLREHREPVGLDELTEYVAARETGTDVTKLHEQQRKRVYVALYQYHLPQMDETGVVCLDSSRRTVVADTTAEQLYRYLPPYSHPPDRWYRYYLGIAAGGPLLWGSTAILGWAGGVGTRVAVEVFVVALLTCSLVHVLTRSGRLDRRHGRFSTFSRRSNRRG
jgi:hypothetical protein